MLLPHPNQCAVTFDKASHTYTINGRAVPSVTTILKRLKPEFNADSKAAEIAFREGTTKAAILAKWKATSDTALANGNALHQYAEAQLNAFPEILPIPEDATNEIRAFHSFWSKASRNLTPIHSETIIADKEYGIAGTIDAVMICNRHAPRRHILDWKTGKFHHTDPYGQRLLAPFEDLPASQYALYSLQVSLYQLMLERQAIPCGSSYIVFHPSKGPAIQIRAMDLRKRLEAWTKSTTGSVAPCTEVDRPEKRN